MVIVSKITHLDGFSLSIGAVSLQNFRSFTNFTADLHPKTVVIGANGSGKSTLVEAIRLLSVGKSFRSSRLDEAIRFDEPFFRITTKVTGERAGSVELFYGQAFAEQLVKDRVLSVDGQQQAAMEFVGTLPSVLFVPSDVDIVMGSPQGRRRYIDGILWQQDPEFREQYVRMGKILKERAASLFLVKINRAGLDELQPWNELLQAVTVFIRGRRQAYITILTEQLAKENRRISGFTPTVRYQIAAEELAPVQSQEIKTAQNLYGPHRDEIEIELNGRSARRYASRGQARTVVLLLKIIEAGYLAEKLVVEPVILLDDILSELDEKNSQFLIEHLPSASQIIATSIQPQTLFNGWKEVLLP